MEYRDALEAVADTVADTVPNIFKFFANSSLLT